VGLVEVEGCVRPVDCLEPVRPVDCLEPVMPVDFLEAGLDNT